MKRGTDGYYHLLYKTTNLLNNRFYIGVHSTRILEYGYLGSGKLLQYEIKKYGKENLKREILEYCDNRESLYLKEREIVDRNLLLNEQCLNLKYGGDGLQSEDIKKLWENPEFRKKIIFSQINAWNNIERKKKAINQSKELWKNPQIREKYIIALKNRIETEESNEKRRLKQKELHANKSEEFENTRRKKISIACKEKCKDPIHMKKVSNGLKKPWENPEFREKMRMRNKGKIYVNDGIKPKMIDPSELEYYLNLGFFKCRKI